MPTQRANTDGRIARGERTRNAIIAAHTELLREGILKPTGKAIADRADVSLRTLWLNFRDLEGLLEATTGYWDTADLQLVRLVDPELPLSGRIHDYCAQRSVRLEHIAPAARSATLGEPFSAALRASRRLHVDRIQSEIAVTFEPELRAAGERRKPLAMALFTASSWPTWSSLRDDFGLDVASATSVLRFTFGALLDG